MFYKACLDMIYLVVTKKKKKTHRSIRLTACLWPFTNSTTATNSLSTNRNPTSFLPHRLQHHQQWRQSSAPPPQPPPKDSLAQRYKFLWLMLLAVNVAVGSPFPFLIPQLCDLLFTIHVFIYVCRCLFLIPSD